jgi:hypothetical protein
MANMIEGGFNTANMITSPSIAVTPTSTPNIDNYLPASKIGSGNYVYVWSGGIASTWNGLASNGINYFGLAAITSIGDGGSKCGCNIFKPWTNRRSSAEH